LWIDSFHYLNQNNPPQGRPPDKSNPSPFIVCVKIYFNIVLLLNLPIHLISSVILILSHVLHRLPVLIICDIICGIHLWYHLHDNLWCTSVMSSAW
jgi:hypothetical protein